MTRVVEVPTQVDDRTFDQFARSSSAAGGGGVLFGAHAAQVAWPDGLLEITPGRGAEDVHDVVEHIQDRATSILTHELGLEAAATMGFGMELSEAGQHIVEQAGTGGRAAVQAD